MSRVALALALVGCGGGSSGPPDRPLTFGGARPATLQVPTIEPGMMYPLVVVLHGYSASGFVQEAYFGMNALPMNNQAFVIAPDGLTDSMGNEFWNADPACCDFDHKNPDDVGYIGGLIDDIIAAWPVDLDGVYVIGHSNGGYMAYRMACDRADVITNIVVLAGAAASDPSTCKPAIPVGVLHMHGTADTTVPYDPNANASVTQWAQHDGCAATHTAGTPLDITHQPGAETQVETFDDCPPGLPVELWSLTGDGHIPSLNDGFSSMIFDYLRAHKRLLPD
jgi:polyhydroxybutyrate depolymerase